MLIHSFIQSFKLALYPIKFFNSDDDECYNGTADCDTNAACDNTIGSYTCTCNTGYNGNGTICEGT